MPRLPWTKLVSWTLVGVVVAMAWVLFDLASTRADLGTLVDTSPADPSAPVLEREVGPDAVRPGGKHDGAYFYVIARDPFDLDQVAAHVDGPRYRLQRIAFPMAAWVLHPTGGGDGLVWAMFAVGVASLVGGGLALGALSVTLRGPPWPAVIFPVMIGSVVSLRISVADPMALALALGALVLFYRGRLAPAVVLAVLAVLAKEPTILVFAGVVLAERNRRSLVLAAVPAAVMGAWLVALTRLVPAGETTQNFSLPFATWPDSIRAWFSFVEPLGFLSILLGVGIGGYALAKRGWRHPLFFVVLVQIGFLVVLAPSVLVPERSASRQVMTMVALGVVMLVTPAARAAVPLAPEVGAGARSG